MRAIMAPALSDRARSGGGLAPLSITFSLSAIVWRGLRKVIYLVPPPTARISQVILSEASTAPANEPSATGGASVASDTLPPAYDHNGGLEIEHVDVIEKA